MNIPELTGSPKQVEWAKKIRQSYITFYEKSRPAYVKKDVEAHPQAKYWIDNRYGLGVTNADQRAIQHLW